MSRLLVEGGEVLAGPGRASERLDVLVQDGRIERVGAQLDVPADTPRLDASELIVMPGLINVHTHGHNNLSRGLAGGRWTLEHLVSFGAALQGNRTAEDHYLSAALGAMEMLATGVTSAYDLYMAIPAADEEVIEAVVAAYTDVGLRVVLAPSLADGPFHTLMPGLLDIVPSTNARRLARLEAVPTRRVLEMTDAAVRRFHGAASGRVSMAVSPSIPGLCSDELLQGMAALAREHGVGLRDPHQRVSRRSRARTTALGTADDLPTGVPQSAARDVHRCAWGLPRAGGDPHSCRGWRERGP